MKKQAIGIFDSGIGGISIWKEITTLLPNENTIYLADSINAPYGQKSKEEIISFCIKNTELLISKGCKLIVVACNTATTNAIEILRETYNIPFIGIEPAIKPAAFKTKTNTVGILATKGTLNSNLFAETSKKHMAGIQIIEQIGEGLVPLIENGQIESENMSLLLKQYLTPMLTKKIDCLVLGCTHYPFLVSQIKKITGTSIEIIDSGLAVAKQTKKVLQQHALLSKITSSNHIIYSNTSIKVLQNFVQPSSNTQIKFKDF